MCLRPGKKSLGDYSVLKCRRLFFVISNRSCKWAENQGNGAIDVFYPKLLVGVHDAVENSKGSLSLTFIAFFI